MLHLLDYLLFSIHVFVIIANLFGWVWKKTRKAHLVVVGGTLASWFVLGIWRGWGYCILTDWEWDIKRSLGEKNLPSSFTRYLSNNVMGMELSRSTVDLLTLLGLILAIVMAILVNWVIPRLRRG